MSDKPKSPITEERARRAFKQAEDARGIHEQLAKDVQSRDANTARLKTLRMERDRLEAEAEAQKPKAKPAKKTVKKVVKKAKT